MAVINRGFKVVRRHTHPDEVVYTVWEPQLHTDNRLNVLFEIHHGRRIARYVNEILECPKPINRVRGVVTKITN